MLIVLDEMKNIQLTCNEKHKRKLYQHTISPSSIIKNLKTHFIGWWEWKEVQPVWRGIDNIYQVIFEFSLWPNSLTSRSSSKCVDIAKVQEEICTTLFIAELFSIEKVSSLSNIHE